MKSLLRRIISIVLSIYYIVIWSIKTIIKENFKNHIVKENHSEDVYILGNGPSLNLVLEDMNNKTNTKMCVVNFSILSPMFRKIKPNYYVIADPAFFIRPYKDDRFKQVIKELNNIDWKLSIFIPSIYYNKFNQELKPRPNIKIIPFKLNPFHEDMGFDKIRYKAYEMGLACPRVQNVVIASIYCMINTGYKKIHLYGVEHSWTSQIIVNKDNQVCLKDTHFYDKNETKSKPWMKNEKEVFKMHEILRTLSYMFIGYHDLQHYAEYLGDIEIINNTKDSFIDAFKKNEK